MKNSVRILRTLMVLTLAVEVSPCFGQDQQPVSSLTFDETDCWGLREGERIRVQIDAEGSGSREVTGQFKTCEDGMLVVMPKDPRHGLQSYRLDQVKRLEVSRGKSGHFLPGAVAGLVCGLMISAATETRSHRDEFLGGLADMEENINRGIAITVSTTLLGAVIGSAMGSETWEAVGSEKWNTSLGADRRGRVQVAVGCSF